MSESNNSFVFLVIIIAAIFVVIGFIFGLFNFPEFGGFSQKQNEAPMDSQVRDLQNLSTSDDVGSIEKDINSTNLDNIDRELNDVDAASKNLQ